VKSVVTGGAGFIGGALARRLIGDGHEVVVFDNLINSPRDQVPDGVEFVEGDVRDLDVLTVACQGADVVFHQAAIRSVPRSLDEPVLVHECNATGSLNVLMAAAATDVRRVVYASSSSVYGGASSRASRETDPPAPLSPYAVSKLTGEMYMRVWALLGRVSTVSLRYFNVFGPGQRADSKYSAVFPAFISSLSEGSAPVIHWDGEQSRDFTFIDDVVDANIAAASAALKVDGPVLNVAGGRPRTVNEVFDAIAADLGSSIPPRRVPKREGDIRHSAADPTLVGEILQWSPRREWDDAVRQTVRWFVRAASVSSR
jgi:nucleoside-diphosphate-sugar epimerase